MRAIVGEALFSCVGYAVCVRVCVCGLVIGDEKKTIIAKLKDKHTFLR